MTPRLSTRQVPGAFDAAAAGYDLLVGLNPGYHQALRRSARALRLPDPDPALRAVRGLLRPGAPLVLHEYSVRDSPLRTAVWIALCWTALCWIALCWTAVIPVGRLVARDHRLYTYLWRSALRFDGAGELRDRLRRNGFTGVRGAPLPGSQLGVVHTFPGRAPQEDRG